MPIAGAGVAAAGSLIGGNQAANAAQDAGNAGAQGGRDAIAASAAFYNQGRQDNYGGMVTGNSALRQLAKLYGLDSYGGDPSWNGVQVGGGETTTDRPSTMQRMLDPGGLIYQQESSTTPMTFSTGNGAGTAGTGGGAPGEITRGTGQADYSGFAMSPDFLVRQEQGEQAISRRNAAMGSYRSGRTDADLARFNARLGAEGFGDYRGALMQLAGFGAQANNSVTGAGMNAGNQINNASQNIGSARASGYANAGYARNDAWNGVGTALGSIWGSR